MLWLLLGCPTSGPSSDTDCPAREWHADADADGHGSASDIVEACDAPAGYVSSSGDCDDGDGAVFPGAAEVCDGADQDCDGAADEDLWAYADADRDGYGDAAVMVPCGDGVDDATDCDDGARGIHPGADEVCNLVDDDCDGAVDAGATDAPSWFADADGDGWGAGAAVAVQCEAIARHVTVGGDCDDGDPAISPGAEEICDNGVDEDCDGGGCRIEDDWDAEAHAAFTVLGETEGEYIMDVGPLWVGSAPGLFVANHEHVWLIRTPPTGEQYVSSADADIRLGSVVTWQWASLGDVDGDDTSELAFTYGGSGETDAVFIVSAGSSSGDVEDVATVTLFGSSDGLAMLGSGRHARDADGDGSVDLAVGNSIGGTAWVVPLTTSGAITDLASTTITADPSLNFGCAVDLGDVDGDGEVDLVVGASGVWDSTMGAPAGAAYLFLGPLGAALTEAEADVRLEDSSIGYWFGTKLQVEGDLDGDGTDDLLVTEYTSARWALFESPSGTGTMAARAYFRSNYTTIDAGDLDGDGQLDLAVGTNSGEGSIYYGPVSDGAHDSSDDDATLLADWIDGAPLMRFVGDLDDDGFHDLGVIAPGATTPRGANAGKVWGLMGSDGL